MVVEIPLAQDGAISDSFGRGKTGFDYVIVTRDDEEWKRSYLVSADVGIVA